MTCVGRFDALRAAAAALPTARLPFEEEQRRLHRFEMLARAIETAERQGLIGPGRLARLAGRAR